MTNFGAETRDRSVAFKDQIDPLAFYESQSVGLEFAAHIPRANERRIAEARRDETIIKTWRAVPGQKAAPAMGLRNGLAGMRDFETQKVIDSERMFFIVLAGMTLLLGLIVAYFVMNFHF